MYNILGLESDVKAGDLVRVKLSDTDPRGRDAGIVIRFDVHHPDSSNTMIQIVEVLWGDEKSWIARERIESICQELTDDDLEAVCGGMSYNTFEVWRVKMLNDRRS